MPSHFPVLLGSKSLSKRDGRVRNFKSTRMLGLCETINYTDLRIGSSSSLVDVSTEGPPNCSIDGAVLVIRKFSGELNKTSDSLPLWLIILELTTSSFSESVLTDFRNSLIRFGEEIGLQDGVELLRFWNILDKFSSIKLDGEEHLS